MECVRSPTQQVVQGASTKSQGLNVFKTNKISSCACHKQDEERQPFEAIMEIVNGGMRLQNLKGGHNQCFIIMKVEKNIYAQME